MKIVFMKDKTQVAVTKSDSRIEVMYYNKVGCRVTIDEGRTDIPEVELAEAIKEESTIDMSDVDLYSMIVRVMTNPSYRWGVMRV